MQNQEQRLMDCKSAALYLGMTESALRKNIHLRRFNKALVRIGGRLFFDKEKLDRLLDELTLNGGENGSQKRKS